MFKISKKIMLSGAIGNALEMYDYAIWGLFSVYLSKEFLPPQSKLSDIYFLFFITYLLRPISGFVFGMLSDQLGRKKILTTSIFMMGICTTAVGLIPSYQSIGVISVFLLLFTRLIQALAVGGEYISSISLLIESCEKNNRGYFGSWAAVGVNAGVLAASLVASILLYAMKMQLIPSNGWRLAFILSFVTMIVGYWIRSSIPESFEFIIKNARKEKRPIYDIAKETWFTIKNHFTESLVVFALVWFGVTASMLIFIYAPIHMTTINNLLDYESFSINSISLILLIILIPIFGMCSDRYGRIQTLFIASFALLIMIVPSYSCISSGSFYGVLFAHLLIAIPCAGIFSITPVLITELFPLQIRCSGAGLIYSIAACFGGGITPLLALKFAHSYESYSLGLLLMFPGLLSLVALLVLHAKKPREMKGYEVHHGLYQ
jgi:MHS family proline/betaine transporter-like MFS transporter